MEWNDNLLAACQDSGVGRTSSEAFFSDVAVLEERKGITENDVRRALSVQTKKGGKLGLAVIVLLPSVAVPSPNPPGPIVDLDQTFQVLEHRELNNGASGTGKSAERAAINLVNLFHGFVDETIGAIWYAAPRPIVPLPLGEDGIVSYGVEFLIKEIPLSRQLKVDALTATQGGGLITLATGTTGAAIYYSINGATYPSEAAGATLYSAPFAEGTFELRAAAYKTDHIPSDLLKATITP